jgi:predicted DNA-binding transcriptional regulator AlpA
MTGKEVANFRQLKALNIMPYSRVHVMRLVRDGKFPEPFKVGEFRGSPLVWWIGEVIEWLDAKAKAGRSSS